MDKTREICKDILDRLNEGANNFRKNFNIEEIEDNVNSPKHYVLNGLNIESKDVFKSILGKELYLGWLWGNALKYLFRWQKKNGLEDLKKCKVYLDWMIGILEDKND